jgi:radical SAM superfamily enzyme YgiQ (UPF0313 family)
MILNCAPPHRYDTPHPGLGYLKAFLEDKGISTKNVYWNLVLSEEIEKFKRGLGHHQELMNSVSTYDIAVMVWKFLNESEKMGSDPVLSSAFSKGELNQVVQSLKNKIDWYIQENHLDKSDSNGFIMKSHQWFINSIIMSRLKEMNPDTHIIIHGIMNEEEGRAFMKVFPHIDFAVWGEDEFLHDLVRAVKENTDITQVPNLVFRNGKELLSTEFKKYPCPNLDEYPFADYTDFFDTLKCFMPHIEKITIPVWGSRSCPWNKCRFCVLNKRYPYRTRSPLNIVEEIEYQSQKHDSKTFIFVDSDFAGSKKRLKSLLECIIKASVVQEEPYQFIGTLSPLFIDSETAQSLNHACFTFILVGFEAVTDNVLRKVQKRHQFAHNIQMLKSAHQYGLNVGALNILKGIPMEMTEDILESCHNLRFLRFLLHEYRLFSTPFILQKGSIYYDEMSEDEKELWNYDKSWAEIAPSKIIQEEDRFEFFGFYKERTVHQLWDEFERVLTLYTLQNRTYTWVNHDNGSLLEEKGPKTYRYTLDRNETDILIFCDSIRRISEVKERISMDEDSLFKMMHALKEAGLLYYDKNMRTIISVVEAWKMEPF